MKRSREWGVGNRETGKVFESLRLTRNKQTTKLIVFLRHSKDTMGVTD
jgi:hypothetical protein